MDRMSRILRDSGAQNIIQDQVITVRDDRYVMPLKPNFRQGIKGVVHGHSGSRATVFVEPLEVVEQNNRLAELRMEEREEVERVLRELTGLLARDAGGIGATLDAAAGIDAIAARARFGTEYQGTVPELSLTAPAASSCREAPAHHRKAAVRRDAERRTERHRSFRERQDTDHQRPERRRQDRHPQDDRPAVPHGAGRYSGDRRRGKRTPGLR